VLLLQDLAVIPMLALVPLLAGSGGTGLGAASGSSLLVGAAVPAAVYAAGRLAFPPALGLCARARSVEAFTMVSLLAAFGAALATSAAGLSLALGGFVMGMALSQTRWRHGVQAVLDPVRSPLMGLFFVAIGMSIDVALVRAAWQWIALGVAALALCKVGLMLGLGRAFGLSLPAAIRTAFLLGQGGEFGFVLFAAAGAVGVLGEAQRAMVLLAIAVSMAATPLLVRLADALAEPLERRDRLAASRRGEPAGGPRHVIVAGYGRVGRIVCLLLEKCDVPFRAFDRDPERVELGQRDGRPVSFGHLVDAPSLAAAGIDRAAAVVVTFGDPAQCERLVTAVRHFHPEVPLHVRVRDLATRRRLLADGASSAVPEATEGSLHLGAQVLRALDVAEDDVLRLLDAARASDYAWLEAASAR
jgi:glutathione-regulated potassium-efflux system protein KefB